MNQLSFATVLCLLVSLDMVSSRSDGGGGSSGGNYPRDGPFGQSPQAVVQSYTFELSREEDSCESSSPSSSSINFILNEEAGTRTPYSSANGGDGGGYQPQTNPLHPRRTSPALAYRSMEQFPNDNRVNEMRGGGDDDCFAVVSAETLYSQDHAAEWDSYRDSFLAAWREFMFEQKEREGEDNDEDDDDDDYDGSCSMLSNAAIKNSNKAKGERVAVPAGGDDSPDGGETHRTRDERPRKGRRPQKSWGLSKPRQVPGNFAGIGRQGPALSNFVALRGGASSAQTYGSEVFQRLFVSALVTLVYESCIGHTLEFIKIDMQTSTAESYTCRDSIKSITSKGLSGLWDGFLPWGCIQAIFKGSVFGLAHHMASQALIPMAKGENAVLPMPLALTMAGGIAGGFQGYVLSPTLLLKTRVMTDPVFRERMSIWRTLFLSATVGFQVVSTEGVTSLMKGANVFALKRVFDWSTRYFFADMFESFFARSLAEGKTLSLSKKSLASLMGGVASTYCTLPLDVLVAKIQDAKQAGEETSAIALFRNELKEKGLARLLSAYMRGFGPRLLHVCLTVVVLKTLSPVVYNRLFG